MFSKVPYTYAFIYTTKVDVYTLVPLSLAMTSFDFPIPSDKEKIKGQKKKKKKKENWRYFILAHTTLPSAFAETIE